MLSVNGLTKRYPGFTLDNVTFDLPAGYIMGFIGANGAGKTTTIKSMMNLTIPDSGSVKIFGKEMSAHEVQIKQEIGLMLGAADYYGKTKLKSITNVFSRFFSGWDERVYQDYLKKFDLNDNKRITELSSGMRVKYNLALALSHGAKLLILDEPTSGLDPVAREELLEIFRGIVDGGDKSILFSTHITSDLDRCADYILFLREGKLIAKDTKDGIIAKHRLVSGSLNILPVAEKYMIGYRKTSFGFTGLMKTEDMNVLEGIQTAAPNLEDIMVFYNKEKKV